MHTLILFLTLVCCLFSSQKSEGVHVEGCGGVVDQGRRERMKGRKGSEVLYRPQGRCTSRIVCMCAPQEVRT